jgi:hypothetical protein
MATTLARGHQVPIERLLNLFDALNVVDAEVVIFEEDIPGAEYAARLWASSRPVITLEVDNIEGTSAQVVNLRKGHRRFISIHRAEVTS